MAQLLGELQLFGLKVPVTSEPGSRSAEVQQKFKVLSYPSILDWAPRRAIKILSQHANRAGRFTSWPFSFGSDDAEEGRSQM